jgi:hypothetical protein
MKKLLLLSLTILSFFIGDGLTYPNKSEDMSFNDADITIKALSQKGFILSEEFIKADDETMLSLLAEAQGLINLSAKEKSDYLIQYKKTTEVYIKENTPIDESVIINKDPTTHSYITKHGLPNFLDIITQLVESQVADQILAEGMELKLLRSGLGKYRDRFEYVYINTKFNFKGIETFSSDYYISVNNQIYHIKINSFEGLGIYDVFTEIN